MDLSIVIINYNVKAFLTQCLDSIYRSQTQYSYEVIVIDNASADSGKDMILKLRDQGKTIVMCSHLLADVQDVCDRIAILYQGDLKELGRVDSLLKVSEETQIKVKGLPQSAHTEILEVIKKHGGDLVSVENPTSTLEDLFLGIVRESQQRPGHRSAGVDQKE